MRTRHVDSERGYMIAIVLKPLSRFLLRKRRNSESLRELA